MTPQGCHWIAAAGRQGSSSGIGVPVYERQRPERTPLSGFAENAVGVIAGVEARLPIETCSMVGSAPMAAWRIVCATALKARSAHFVLAEGMHRMAVWGA